MIRFFAAVTLILFPQNVMAAELYPYQVFGRDNCVIYDNFPTDMAIDVVWTGSCENGKASGAGIALFISDRNEVVFQFEGDTNEGLLSGKSYISWPRSGTNGIVDYSDGVISGTGLVLRTSRDGGKFAAQSEWDNNNPIRNEKERLFFQASDADGYSQQVSIIQQERNGLLDGLDDGCAAWSHKAEAGILLRNLAGTNKIHNLATVGSISSVASCYAFEDELDQEASWMLTIASDNFVFDEAEEKHIATLVELYAASLLQESTTDAEKEDAAKWYIRAANLGNPKAQNYVGLWHATGRYGLQENRELASNFYRLAAEQGLAVAQFNLGFSVERAAAGSVLELEEALGWYLKAHEQEYNAGSMAAAILLSRHNTPFSDRVLAMSIFENQSSLGNSLAQAKLSFLLAEDGRISEASNYLLSLWQDLEGADSRTDKLLRETIPISIMGFSGVDWMSRHGEMFPADSASELLELLFRVECGQIENLEERESTIDSARKIFTQSFSCIDSKYVYPGITSNASIRHIVGRILEFYDLKAGDYSYTKFTNQVNYYLLERQSSDTSFALCSENNFCDGLGIHPINYRITQEVRAGQLPEFVPQLKSLIERYPSLQSKVVLPEGFEEYVSRNTTSKISRYFDTPQILPNYASVRIFRCDNYCDQEITSGGGSGVFIDSKTILTNFHVINGHQIPSMNPGGDRIVPNQIYKIFIETAGTQNRIQISQLASFIRGLPSARYVDGSPEADLAILKLDRPVSGVFIAPIEGDGLVSDQKFNFSPIANYGYPGLLDVNIHPAVNLRQFTSEGSLQGLAGYNIGNLPISARMMSSGGMSGGPVLNSCGRLIGLNTLGGHALGHREFDRNGAIQNVAQMHALLRRNPQINFSTFERPCLKTGSVFLRSLVGQYGESKTLAAVRFQNGALPVSGLHLDKGYLVFTAPDFISVGDRVYIDGLLGDTLDAQVVELSSTSRIALAVLSGDHSRDLQELREDNILGFEGIVLSSENSSPQNAYHFAGVVDYDADEQNTQLRTGIPRREGVEEKGSPVFFELGRFAIRGENVYGIFGRSTLGSPVFDKCGYLAGIMTEVERSNTNLLNVTES
jgi:hypothetical protein